MSDEDPLRDSAARAAWQAALARKYPSADEARVFASHVGLDPLRIAFQPRADLTWFSLLEEARKQGGRWVQAVIDRALAEFPGDDELRRLKAEIRTPPPDRAARDRALAPTSIDPRSPRGPHGRTTAALPHAQILRPHANTPGSSAPARRMSGPIAFVLITMGLVMGGGGAILFALPFHYIGSGVPAHASNIGSPDASFDSISVHATSDGRSNPTRQEADGRGDAPPDASIEEPIDGLHDVAQVPSCPIGMVLIAESPFGSDVAISWEELMRPGAMSKLTRYRCVTDPSPQDP
jgi:hypothetical protein